MKSEIIYALKSTARRANRAGAPPEQVIAWVREALARSAPRGYQKGPDLAWRETIAYGSRELRMTDAAMARELGVTRERIRQIRRKTGEPIVRCSCGSRAREGGQCGACKKKKATALAPCRLDCGRRTRRPDGRCFRCYQKVRYREDPEFRAKLYAIQKRSNNRSPDSIARHKATQRKANHAFRARRRAARQAEKAAQGVILLNPWREPTP